MGVCTTRIKQESPHRYMPWISSDEEKRKLRCAIDSKNRGLLKQKGENKKLEDELKLLRERLKKEHERNEELEKTLDKTKKQRDRYRDLLFKRKTRGEQAQTISEESKKSVKKRKRGAQIGHKWHGYDHKREVDRKKRIYLTNCPDCEAKLKRTNGLYSHKVEDIPSPEILKTEITQYDIEKQWCPCCKSIKKAVPLDVIPKSRYGINVLMYIIIQKYNAKSSLEAIANSLEILFGLKISKGGIVAMLHRTKNWLGADYDRLLTEIRGAQIKHADETGWRIEGINHWIWGFFTKKTAYYRIEESRGKGVPEKVLEGSNERDVLVRDDYRGYQNLSFNHQSCWAHLLRKSRELAKYDNASDEVKNLNKELKAMFKILQKSVKEPFKLSKRKQLFIQIELSINQIIEKKFEKDDAKEVQTRISNQGTNLITALLFEGAPLTNNLAERLLRPLVVKRKMSGGSKTLEAAQIHMVIMSVLESIKLKSLPILPSLRSCILSAATAH